MFMKSFFSILYNILIQTYWSRKIPLVRGIWFFLWRKSTKIYRLRKLATNLCSRLILKCNKLI
jgi:hypothetical protein